MRQLYSNLKFGIAPSRDCRHHYVTHAKNLAILDALMFDLDYRAFV